MESATTENVKATWVLTFRRSSYPKNAVARKRFDNAKWQSVLGYQDNMTYSHIVSNDNIGKL